MIVLLLVLIFYSSYILLYAELYVNDVLTIGWQFFAIYVVSIILFLIKYRKKTLFNPEFLFSIIFLFCTFLYLPILFNSGINTFIFGELANESNLNLIRSQSIVALSIQFYLLGAVLSKKKKTRTLKQDIEDNKSRVLIEKRKVFHVITLILITLSMITGGWKIIFRYTEKSVGLDEIGGFFAYITIFLVISSALEFLYMRKMNICSLKLTLKQISRLYLFNILFMSLLYFFAGFRSAVFPILIPVVFLYDVYVRKINKIGLIAIFIGAFVLMSVMKETRAGKSVEISNVFSVEYIGGDFTSANKAMYYLIDHTDKHGSQQGQNAILQMVSFIPYAQSTLINFFGVEPSDSSSKFFTEGLNAYWGGLGTHVVGDLYYSFGLLGTLFWMFLLGFVTSILYKKVTKKNQVRIWELVVYLLILGNSLMFSRVEFFFTVRNIGIAVIVIWVFNKLYTLNRI